MPWRVPSASFPLLASSTASALTARPTCASCRHSWCRTFAKKSKTQTQRGPARVKHARLLGDGKPYHKEQLEGELKVTGLVRSVRKQKHNAFVHISDGTTYAPIQAILSPELAKDITNGAYVELLGKWQASPAKGQSHELQVTDVQFIGQSNPEENPIQKQSMTADYLRTIPHLRTRTPFQSLLARTRSQLIDSVCRHFYEARGHPAVQVQPPLITSSDCEGAGEVFTIAPQNSPPVSGTDVKAPQQEPQLYFREPKYLTVSSQLHLEAYSAELGDVWTLSPTFRAEESDTPRHLAEFYMLEAEFRGVTRLEALQGRVQSLIQHLVASLRAHRTGCELLDYYADRRHRPADSETVDLAARWDQLSDDFVTVSYTTAVEELQKAQERTTFVHSPDWTRGLQLEHERWIVEHIGHGRPTFVTHYPKSLKPFYMLPSATSDTYNEEQRRVEREHGETVACFDLLLPYGYCEVVGGSLREHRLPELIDSMREKGLVKKGDSAAPCSKYPYLRPGESLGPLQWYADLRRFGSSPHGGFGLGFDRLLAYLSGTSNVRDVVGYPRTWGRADC